jgi:hypothetical protein
MASSSSPLTLEVLRIVGRRPAKSGYERPAIPDYPRAQIDAAVDELRRGGYLEGAHVKSTFGDNPAHWAPSVLTASGRHLLEELEREK